MSPRGEREVLRHGRVWCPVAGHHVVIRRLVGRVPAFAFAALAPSAAAGLRVRLWYKPHGGNTWDFVPGSSVYPRITPVSCYALEADRGFRYLINVQSRFRDETDKLVGSAFIEDVEAVLPSE